MPIGAVLVSPEVTDVIYSQSNKLGESILKANPLPLGNEIVHNSFFPTRYIFPWIYLLRASCLVCGRLGNTEDLQVCNLFLTFNFPIYELNMYYARKSYVAQTGR